jgi:hypothetical protein
LWQRNAGMQRNQARRVRLSGDSAGAPTRGRGSPGRRSPAAPPPSFLGAAIDQQQLPIDQSLAERTANGDPRLRHIFDTVRQAPPPPQPGRLNLNYDCFGDEGGRCLGAALKGLPEPLRLCSIGIASCGLTASGMAAVVAGLRGRSFAGAGLRALNASGNAGLGDDGVVELLRLELPPTLEELYLANVGLGDAGMAALAAALPAMSALRTLSVNANPAVAERGWAALGAALPQLPALSSLQAEECVGMRDSGAAALAVGIPGALSLETVNLHGCGIGDEGARVLAVVMRGHRQEPALHVYLTANDYGAAGKAALDDAAAEHRTIAFGHSPGQQMKTPGLAAVKDKEVIYPIKRVETIAECETTLSQVRKRHFIRHLHIKPIVLPRQARDKHRESSQNRGLCVFLQELGSLDARALRRRGCETRISFAPCYAKNDHVAKTGSGPT